MIAVLVATLVVREALCSSSPARAAVEVYTTPGCRYCSRAKSFLRRRGVGYSEIDVSEDAEVLGEMIERAGSATLPQIFVAGDHIGGCTQLLSEHDTGALAERFDQAGIVWAEPTPEEQCSVTANGGSSANGRTSGGAIKRGANSVLNAPIVGSSALDDALGDGAGSAAALSTALQKRMLLLMDDHLLDDGSRVDYARLRVSPAFASFCEAAGALRDVRDAAPRQSRSTPVPRSPVPRPPVPRPRRPMRPHPVRPPRTRLLWPLSLTLANWRARVRGRTYVAAAAGGTRPDRPRGRS